MQDFRNTANASLHANSSPRERCSGGTVSASAYPAYDYQGLDEAKREFRLLKFDRSLCKTSHIRCHLETFDFEEAPIYAALSYRWTYTDVGSNDTRYPVVVNGGLLNVSENLFHFFDSFRNDPNSRWLWIDQVCINQDDVIERRRQVEMMSDIYRQCANLIIWLGSVIGPKDDYIALLNNTYFSRVWVIQEILLVEPENIEILVSNIWIPWVAILRLFLKGGLTYPRIPLWSVSLLDRASQPATTSLATLLWNLDVQQCGDPRDHVYGLLGLVSPEQRPDVDYTKTTWEVFLDTALSLGEARHDPPHICGLALGTLGSIFTYGEGNQPITRLFDLSELLKEMRYVEDGGIRQTHPTLMTGPKKILNVGLRAEDGEWWFDLVDAGKKTTRIHSAAQAKLDSKVLKGLDWVNKYSL